MWPGWCPWGSSGMKFKMHFHLWHACWKPCSFHGSSLLYKWTISFFFSSNLSLPVSAHFNLLCLHHTTFTTFFWLNIVPCWRPPTQPTSLLFCITPSCSMRHRKMSWLCPPDRGGSSLESFPSFGPKWSTVAPELLLPQSLSLPVCLYHSNDGFCEVDTAFLDRQNFWYRKAYITVLNVIPSVELGVRRSKGRENLW